MTFCLTCMRTVKSEFESIEIQDSTICKTLFAEVFPITNSFILAQKLFGEKDLGAL